MRFCNCLRLFSLKPLLVAAVLLLTGTLTSVAAAETAYISDVLTVPLRSGPSNANRILHRGLPSGTKLQILASDSDTNFVQVRTDSGTEGWLPRQYLVDEPIARDRLVQANAQIARLNETVAGLRERLNNIGRDKNEAETSSAELAQQVTTLQQELAEITRISAGAIEANEQNRRLSELNQRLRTEVDELLEERQTLLDNAQQRWLLIGAGLVLLGLALGVIIKSRPRRSAWS